MRKNKKKKIFLNLVTLILILFPTFLSATEDKVQQLHDAIANGDIKLVKLIILEDNSLIEAPNRRGSTPLAIAAADGMTEILEFLIESGAKVNVKNNFQNTPLHYAAWAGNIKNFKILLQNKADIKAENSQKDTPFQYAAMGGNLDIIKTCIKNGYDVNFTTEGKEATLIHWSAYGGSLDVIKFFESQGLDIYKKDKDGSTAIFWAASGGNLDMIKYLVEEKAMDINSIDSKNKTPLNSSISGGKFEASKYFIENGANMNHELENNENWLHQAAQSSNTDLISLLIEKEVNIHQFNDYGQTPLHIAVSHGNMEVVKQLIDNGAKINPGQCSKAACTDNGLSPLHNSCWSNFEIMEYLISKGADVNATSKKGDTPLHYAAKFAGLENLKLLLEKECDINKNNNFGETALHLAIKNGKLENAKFLIENSISVNAKDNNGNTPLHIASINGYGEIVKMLVTNNAELNTKNKNGQTPAYIATYYGNESIVKSFIDQGVEKKTLPFEKAELLTKEIKNGEAVIWYLNHGGWAIKTKEHLLIFDYWQRNEAPDVMSINNGFINPEEIKDLNVTVCVSHSHGDHFSQSIFKWEETVKNIDYVLGFENTSSDNIHFLPGNSTKSLKNINITTIPSTDSGVGFLVEVDGVIFFHAGDHAKRSKEDNEFTKEIDYLAKFNKPVDFAFIPVSGCGFRDKVALKEGNDYILKKLNPEVVFPMHAGNNEINYKEYAEEAKDRGQSTQYLCVLNKGDRIIYSKHLEKKYDLVLNLQFPYVGDVIHLFQYLLKV